jgi:hypothetical protein
MNGEKGSVHKVVLFLVVFLLLAFGLFYFLGRKNNNSENNQQLQIDWEIPELPEGFNWTESYVEKSESEKSNFVVFVEERYSNKDIKDMFNGKIFLPGKIYKVSLTDKDSSYNSTGHEIEVALRNALESTGWAWSTRYGDYLISGMSSSGLQGNTSGYVKIEQGLLRTYIYSYVYDGNWVSSQNEPPHLECPCTVNMSIFVSDSSPIADYLPAIQQ